MTTTTGAGLDHVQVGIVKMLRASSEIAALCGARIYDDVPNSSGPTPPSFPYIALSQAAEEEANAEEFTAANFTYQINAWSRAGGSIEAKQVIKAIRRALHEKSISTVEGRITFIHWVSAQYLPSPDGETYPATITFRGHVTYREN